MTLRFTPIVLLALVLGCSSETSAPVLTSDASTTDTSVKPTDTGGALDTSATCTAPEIKCGGVCVDPTSDATNCGLCGNTCGAGQTCMGGACRCESPKALCGAACVDTQSDAANCGTCGKSCPTGNVCSEGSCSPPCPTGQTRCGGLCVSTASDAKHCGVCGKACATGEGCTDGVCGIVCEFPTKNCGGTCININFDAKNCGACGKVCPSGTKGTPNCTSGSCVLTCSAGFGNCDDDATNGCEVDLASADRNCGVCGTSCTSFETCLSSKCECKTGSTRCSGTCVDITASDANCGSCGRVCPSGESCSSSTCVCKSGFTRCGSTCVDTRADTANCGACGVSCGSGVCSSGKCCPSGQINCGGVCVDPTSSKTNCGACGTTCSGGTPYCVGGACAATCGGGLTDCSGTCTSTATDVRNCGACGNVCATNEICFGSACVAGGFPGSTIVNAAEGTKINTWVGSPGNVWKLCYSLALHGNNTATFHTNCDSKGPTVTLTRFVDSLGTTRIIGGYTSVSFLTTGGWKGDPTGFLFNITGDYKHELVSTSSTIVTWHGSGYGPYLGSPGMGFYPTMTLYQCGLGTYFKCRTGLTGTACTNDFCGSSSGWSTQAIEVWFK